MIIAAFSGWHQHTNRNSRVPSHEASFGRACVQREGEGASSKQVDWRAVFTDLLSQLVVQPLPVPPPRQA